MNVDSKAGVTLAGLAIPYKRISQLALGVVLCGVAWLVFVRVVKPAGMLGWDESAHALNGLVLAQDLGNGDLVSFLYDVYRQVYWPPVYAVMLAIAFMVFNATTLVARTMSLAMLLLGAGIVYGCGASVDRRRGPLVAFISAALYLTAPVLAFYAGQVMLELPALAAMYLAVWMVLRLDADSPPARYIWLGLASALVFLTKLNYGLLLLIVIAVEFLIEVRFRFWTLFNKRMLFLALAVIIPLALWFAYTPKLTRTWQTLINQPFGVAQTFSVEGLLFYPRAFVELCGSPLLCAIFVAGIARALWHSRRDRALRILVLIIVVQFTLGQLHHTKVDRHLFPLLPAMYICTASLLANLGLERYLTSGRSRLAKGIAVMLLLLLSGQLFYVSLRPASMAARPYVADVIAQQIGPADATLVLGTGNVGRPAPPQLDWLLAADYGLLPASRSDIVMNLEQDQTMATLAGKLPGPAFLREALVRASGRSRAASQVRTLYVGIDGGGYSQSPAALYQFLKAWPQDALFNRALVIVPIDLGRSYVPIGGSPYAQEFLTEPLERLGFVEQTQQDFEDVNVRILIYEKRP